MKEGPGPGPVDSEESDVPLCLSPFVSERRDEREEAEGGRRGRGRGGEGLHPRIQDSRPIRKCNTPSLSHTNPNPKPNIYNTQGQFKPGPGPTREFPELKKVFTFSVFASEFETF